jgi:ribonuclease HII
LKNNLNPGEWEAACDEVGRGCIAGPVFAAAVLFHPDQSFPDFIKDSKQLSESTRTEGYEWIQSNAVSWCISMQGPKEIDELNILWASVRAMHLALDGLVEPFSSILVDGHKFLPYKNIPHHCIIKGDSKFFSIAAASILAKVSRDWWMQSAGRKFAYYDWENNKGYPTKKHKEGISIHGFHFLHRRTFISKFKAEQRQQYFL